MALGMPAADRAGPGWPGLPGLVCSCSANENVRVAQPLVGDLLQQVHVLAVERLLHGDVRNSSELIVAATLSGFGLAWLP